MVRREVQCLEVVPVVLDLRTVGQLVAEPAEDFGDPLQRARHRVDAAALPVAARQGHVDGLTGQARVERGFLQHRPARGQRLPDLVADPVDGFAGGLALVGRQGAQLLELGGDAALLAQQSHAQGFQCVGRLRGGDVGQRARGQGFDFAHGVPGSGVRKNKWGRTRALPHVSDGEPSSATFTVERRLRPPGRSSPSRPAP